MQGFLNIAVIGTVITAAILAVGIVASASAMTMMPGNQTGGKMMKGNATGGMMKGNETGMMKGNATGGMMKGNEPGMMKGNETGMMKGNLTTPPLLPKKQQQ
jgi:hypothetical protein